MGPSPILKQGHSNHAPSEGQKMVSAALASWQLVVTEARNEEYCSPLPQSKQNQKFVADLLQKSSIAFKKEEKDEQKEEKPTFSARRSLYKLLSFSRLNSIKANQAQSSQSSNNSFLGSANAQKNVTMVPQSRSESVDTNEQPGKAKNVNEEDEAEEEEKEEIEIEINDENVNTENIAKSPQHIIKSEENVIENVKRNRSKWNKEQVGKEHVDEEEQEND